MSNSPMMQQYLDAKAACPDSLLLFRMGDFYELFFDDAKTAATVLGLTLTSRDKGENAVPMAGFPHHQLENYLAKLIAAGLRGAICDQVEDPRQAKGIVRREVTRIVSRGTLTDDALLDPRASNYLAALVCDGGDKRGERAAVGLAWVELSTGRFFASQFAAERLADELARIAPVECLVSDAATTAAPTLDGRMTVTCRPAWAFAHRQARDALHKHFGTTTLEGFGFADDDTAAVRAAGAVLDYLAETQRTSLGHLDRLTKYRVGSTLEIDEATRRSLEISRTLRDGRREGSLLAVLDRTATAAGSRLLGETIANPLTDIAAIDARLDAVAELVAQPVLAGELREQLRQIHDIERLLARVTTGRATPRDLSGVARTLRVLPVLKAKLTARSSALLNRIESSIDLCPELRAKLETALEDDCPLVSNDGGFIRPGYSAELDALRELTSGGKQWIAKYQADEAARSGIVSLKVGFNSVFGYYLEITNTHRDKVPQHYIRKQTVKNAERYITPELKEYEQRVLTADERSKSLEQQLFVELRDLVGQQSKCLRTTADALAKVDVLAGFSELARQRGYCRPTMVTEPVLRIIEGRHPVLDALVADGSFVPNDVTAGPDAGLVLLITGPNMAGKSTYIRQAALITLMAQLGSFVPAREATIGIADRIFARVGASDELSRGQSTFMVEMTETARILNTATERSLVILDEIGRGTSTYDGVSLAWSVVEHLHQRIGCRTLFATHYHELTQLETTLPRIRNLNVAVREWQDDLVFLHQIVAGAADKSYGIHVARLAGVPRTVLERAKQILSQLEQDHLDARGRPKWAPGNGGRSGDLQLSLFAEPEHPLLSQIRELDLDRLTPLEALALLGQWQRELDGGESSRRESHKAGDAAGRAARELAAR
ncbi:MAG TPA: DNA mismatch repair protein MutS [Pirellulales bacterium]|nr:DNA mismatch repair protein MutS [Pirellulales bacterium]